MPKIVHHQPDLPRWIIGWFQPKKREKTQQKWPDPGPSLPALCWSLLRIDVVFAPVDQKKTKYPGSFHGFMATVENDTRCVLRKWYCWWFRNTANQLMGSVSHYLQYNVFYIRGGAGFLPSTVGLWIWNSMRTAVMRYSLSRPTVRQFGQKLEHGKLLVFKTQAKFIVKKLPANLHKNLQPLPEPLLPFSKLFDKCKDHLPWFFF